MSIINGNRMKALVAAAVLSAAVALGSHVSVLAATGTVTGSNINVRSDASTTSSIVGTANNGDELEVGESKTDSAGSTWYQVTLTDGSVGYIRNEFITVSEDTAEAPAEASTEAATVADEATTAEDTAAAASSTGDYQVVQAPDENGQDTYYLYNNAAGERMKISDIEALQDRIIKAEADAANVKNQYRLFLIILAALVIVAVIVCILLFVRLRDALTNGRRERDLTQDRVNARRTGRGEDGLSDLKRRERSDRRPAGAPAGRNPRGDAYASGTTRRPAPAHARRRPMDDDRRPVREGGRPERPERSDRPVRPARPEGEEGVRRAPEGAARREGAPVRRPARPVDDDSDMRVRPAARPERTERPERSERPAPKAEPARKPQAKNFADDDDFDYDFISLDDDK